MKRRALLADVFDRVDASIPMFVLLGSVFCAGIIDVKDAALRRWTP
jgi:hypothetical protein